MELFGLTITRRRREKSYPVPIGSGGWWPIWPNVQEPTTGAWQANLTQSTETIVANSTVFSCISLISSDISKMDLGLVTEESDGIFTPTEVAAFSPVLRTPNDWQNTIQFLQSWVLSKLIHGNTYVLKRFDARGTVEALYVLDPRMVRVLVSPDGSVFYSLSADNLSSLDASTVVPARFIIHDRYAPIYHGLVGVSPIHACAMAAIQGLQIQNNSTRFFTNGSRPGGLLSAPGAISPDTALRIKEYWETNFSGSNFGKIAVAGDGLKYESLSVNAEDAQLIEQLKWTAETICSCFHVPPYMVNVGPPPNYNNIEALNRQYYNQCLQIHIVGIQRLLTEGLALPKPYRVHFDLDDLLLLDSATMMTTIAAGIGAGVLAPNEGRKKINLPPVQGGDTPYLQNQQWSLADLDRRSVVALEPPPAPAALKPAPDDAEVTDVTDETRALQIEPAVMEILAKGFADCDLVTA